jgi:hypothetical protein
MVGRDRAGEFIFRQTCRDARRCRAEGLTESVTWISSDALVLLDTTFTTTKNALQRRFPDAVVTIQSVPISQPFSFCPFCCCREVTMILCHVRWFPFREGTHSTEREGEGDEGGSGRVEWESGGCGKEDSSEP